MARPALHGRAASCLYATSHEGPYECIENKEHPHVHHSIVDEQRRFKVVPGTCTPYDGIAQQSLEPCTNVLAARPNFLSDPMPCSLRHVLLPRIELVRYCREVPVVQRP